MKKMKWKSMVLWILFAFLCIGGIQADAANGDGEKDYTFPDSATLVYGEKFEDAVLNGGSGDGEFLIYDTDTWSHVTNNRDARMAAGDLGNRAEKYVGEVSGRYAVWFLPADGSEGRGQPITVTFLPKPVTVVINNVTRVYGDTVSYTYDEKNIKYAFDDDKTSGLGIKLSAVDEDGNPVTEKTPVGTYKIVGEATSGESRYYDITFQTGELTITPKEAELTWQGYENLTYNPEGKTNVTATVSNLLDGDTCNVTVENGSNVDAGEYTAKAVKLDNSNYQLPTSSGLTQSYTIEKATPDCADVTAALTYGQTLGEAKIQGAAADPTTKKSLPGSFRFEAEDTIPSVADSQTTKYAMKFYPEDAANYNEVSIDEYDMTVSRKSLKVQIMDREKTYGDAMSVEDLLSYDKSELVGEDKLVVTLTATNENGSEATLNPVYIDAGSYTVGASQNTLDSENPNYAITVKTGELTVQKRPVELEWSDVSNIIYQYVGGAENPTEWAKVGANVTASITNLVQQEDGTFDDCQVVVEDGNKTEPSKNGTSAATVYYAYAAELLGSASQNYTFAEKLPETPWKIADVYESSRLQPYVIREPGDCVFPAAMVMTYGESIGDARMLAGSGDGAFEIVDKDGQSVTDRKPSAGIYEEEYKVKFTPSDGSGVSYGTAMLIVKKAPLAVTADNVTKTYGEGKPEYTWKVTDGKLADGDDVKELLTVKSVAGESSGDEKTSEVNIYEIVLEKQINENYDLTFVGAKLTVEPREIEIVWSDTSNLVY